MSQIKVCSSALAAHRGSVAGNKFNILREQISRLSDSVRRRKKRKKETATTLHCDQKTTRTRSFTEGHRWSSGLLSEKLITTTRPATVPWFESRASGAIRCDFPLQTIFLGGGNGLKLDPLAARRSCTAASGITMLKRCSSAITSPKFC